MNRSRIVDLALLCLLSGSGWLLEHFYPRAVPFPFSGSLHFLLIGVVATVFWLLTGKPKIPVGKAGVIAFSGMVLFALPGIVVGISSGAISEFTSLALFCSVPLMMVLMLEAFEWTGVPGATSRALPTSVLGLGGALLLFPVQLPGVTRGWICFALVAGCCAFVAFAGIELHRMIQGVPVAAVVALVSFGCAALLGACGVAGGWPPMSLRSIGIECLRCLVFDLPVLWLTAWLIRGMDPYRLSARFLIVPVVTAIEGFAVTGGVSLQAGVGMALMAGCGVMSVLDQGRDEEQDASSLHLR